MDGKEHFDVLDLYLSAYLQKTASSRDLAKQYHTDVKVALNDACQLGAYDALLVRCETSFNAIRENAKKLISSGANKDALITLLDQDTTKFLEDNKRLSNLYWGLGYVQAACRLYTLSQLSFQTEGGESAENEEKTRKKICIEQAVQHFLCAAALDQNDSSKMIMHNIIGEKNIFVLINEFFKENALEIQLTDWPQGKLFFHQRLGQARYDDIEIQANNEIKNRFASAKQIEAASHSSIAPAAAASSSAGSSVFFAAPSATQKKKATDALVASMSAKKQGPASSAAK
jgi:hypothetical protein